MNKFIIFTLIFIMNPNAVFAWDNTSTNFAGLIFTIFVLVTLVITFFASKKY